MDEPGLAQGAYMPNTAITLPVQELNQVDTETELGLCIAVA
jgi:hypothetical protein